MNFSKIKHNFIEFLLNYQKTAFTLGLLLAIMLSCGLPLLESNFGFKVWYKKDDSLLVNFRKFEKEFGNDDQILISLEFKDSVLKDKNIKIIKALTEKLWLVRNIIRVDSITNYSLVYGEDDEIIIVPVVNDDEEEPYSEKKTTDFVEKDRVVEGYLISKDRRVALLYANLKPSFDKTPDYRLIIQDINKLLKDVPAEVTARVSGNAKLTEEFRASSVKDFTYVSLLIHSLFFIVLILIFRNLMGIIYSFLIIWPAVASSLGFQGFLGYEITVISSIMPIILITVGLADSVHILSSFRIGVRDSGDYKQALRYSLEKNFYPTLFTTLSTSIGFLSFLGASLVPIKHMGITTGVGVLLIWVLTYLFTPIILWSEKVSWLKFKNQVSKESTFTEAKAFLKFINKRFKIINISSIIILVASIFLVTKLIANINPYEQFKKGHPLRETISFLSQKIKGITPIEIVIDSKKPYGLHEPEFLQKVETFTIWLNDLPYVHKTVSIINVLKQMNEAFNQKYELPTKKKEIAEQLLLYTMSVPEGKSLTTQMNLNRSQLRLTAYWSLKWSAESLAAIKVIEQKAKEMGLKVNVTGKLPIFLKMNPYVVDTFVTSFFTALILITLFLMLCLKSFRLGLLALVPNVFPIFLGGAVFYMLGFTLDLGTTLVSAVCLGIAVDDSIHLLFEFVKHRNAGMSFNENMEMIIERTFPALFFTTILLVIGFGSLFTADYIPNIKFGVSVAGILGIALLADFVILPSLLRFFYANKKLN